MPTPLDPLVTDLVAWVSREPRTYAEAIEAWRTSCPRLTVWEDAIERGFIERRAADGAALIVATAEGAAFLAGRHKASGGSRTASFRGGPKGRARNP